MIGGENEIEILEKALNSGKPELVAIIERRRVGKQPMVRCTKSVSWGFKGDQIYIDETPHRFPAANLSCVVRNSQPTEVVWQCHYR